MKGVVADTHALLWYLLDQGRLSDVALRTLDEAAAAGVPVSISAISLVEIIYLVEKGRLPSAAWDRIDRALHDPDAAITVVPLDTAVAGAMAKIPRDQVPDMPDRIIAATALHLGLPLVSRDRKILVTDLDVIW